MASLIMDGVVALLLVATIWFAIQLNRRLGMLRADGERMERLIAGLSAASHRAEEAVGDLKDTAGHAGRQLQGAIDKGGTLLADLQFMTDKANTAADRLDETLRAQRNTAARPSGQNTEIRAADVTATEQKPRRASPGPARDAADTSADEADKQVQNRLASLLKQAEASTRTARAKTPAAPLPPPSLDAEGGADAGATPRPIALQSRAEREFLKALEGRK